MKDSIMQLIEIVASAILILIIILFIFLLKRSKGGSSKTFMSVSAGATYDLLSEDQKRAAETIVEKNAGKKMEEQGRAEPPEKGE